MQLDFQSIAIGLLGILAGMGGWFIRQIWDAVTKLQSDMRIIERDLPRAYVAKSDFADAMREIREGLTRIYDKIDGKADKP